MSDKIWIGGGDNSVYNPADWSPPGAPAPGDILEIQGGTANMEGGHLDELALGVPFVDFPITAPPPLVPSILNMSDGANISDLTDRNVLSIVNVQSSDTISNIKLGSNTVGSRIEWRLTINIAPHSILHGSINSGGDLHILGDSTSKFDATGANTILSPNDGGTNAIITPDVIGTATWDISGFFANVEFGGSVSGGQTIMLNNDGRLTVDDPVKFHATVDVGSNGALDLKGILDATSYSLKNDILSLYDGNKVIDRVHVLDAAGAEVSAGPAGVQVGGSVFSPPYPTVLPQHS